MSHSHSHGHDQSHSHGHDPSHGHSHSHDTGSSARVERFNEANRRVYSDQKTPTFELPQWKALSRLCVAKMLQLDPQGPSAIDESGKVYTDAVLHDPITDVWKGWSKQSTKLLDFACGPGSNSKDFAPFVNATVGVDISQDAVDQYNRTVAGGKAFVLDLAQPDQTQVNQTLGSDFDAVISAMAFHHLGDYATVAKNLVTHLKPAGRLLVVDLYSDGGKGSGTLQHISEADAEELGVSHQHGFTQAEFETLFTNAGLVDMNFVYNFTIDLWFGRPAGEQMGWTDKFLNNAKTRQVGGQTEYLMQLRLVLASGTKPSGASI